MHKSVQHTGGELSKIRASKASPTMVEDLKVEYYGTMTPISQVANISAPDPRTLLIKPRVSGGSKNTFALNRQEAEERKAALDTLFSEEGYMVQPFLAEVPEKGEWSFVFFRGQFSHSVLKKAKSGDFRVQHYLGGSIYPTATPPQHLLAQATRIARHFAAECLYARVDGIEVGEDLLLMELELIEPFLFLFTHGPAFAAYHQALLELALPLPDKE